MNPSLNAFITVCDEHALESAAALDRELRSGSDRGPLHGIPIVHKDIFDTAGIPTTFGSPLHRGRVPSSDATPVARLRAAGTVLLGKTNMTEFAADASGRNAFYGDVRNPRDHNRSAGGSSSGTAAAVAASLCLGGTGSDTGGSIRIPASWCGVVGLRPTWGLISMKGAFPRAPSLDCAGPMARTVKDAALLLDAMLGNDEDASASVSRSHFSSACDAERLDGLRLGTIEGYTYQAIDPQVARAVNAAMTLFAGLGANVRSVQVPILSGGALDYSSLFNVLLYEFHEVLGETYRQARDRERWFGPVVRANLERGAQIAKSSYERALNARSMLVSQMRKVFADVDALVVPTMPRTAALLTEAPEAFDEGRRFNLPTSYLGFPSISVPCGTDTTGMPIGLLIIADRFGEATLLRAAAAFERAAHRGASGATDR